MLDEQIHLYSIDTGFFFSNHEKNLHQKYCTYLKEIKKMKTGTPNQPSAQIIRHKQKNAKAAKEKLQALLARKAGPETPDRIHQLRTLREQDLRDTHVISVFTSMLTRCIGIEPDTLSDKLMVVQVYHFEIFRELVFYGFSYQGRKYRYFTSSAGQIRQKKAMFIEETVWNDIRDTIMCGLTVEKINAMGGNNVNKHLAYMALSNSATDEWTGFDIDKTLVIEDFETEVPGIFDYIDETDYSITRKEGTVPVNHTDGAGMILPQYAKKNFMFRAPWIKGLLGVFDFRKFIAVHQCSPLIKDIYGQTHNVIEEDIRIIFTKSQFKMHAYYTSWSDYQNCFKKYHCTAGRCNIEEDRIKNASINYQMLQTLTDFTEEELATLTKKSAERLNNLCSSKENMMQALGITPYNLHMTPFQQAVKMYPALLNDAFVKDMLRDIKNSLLKKYRSGKLEIFGKYTFILPDFYAACEHWFLHEYAPVGLLDKNEVFCRLFPKIRELDCLRSPHLYKEHAVRINTAARNSSGAEKIGEWFVTNGLYTSSHDLISKILQFDVDGDKALVVAEPDFVRIAGRNMAGIVPLYYNMKKAAPDTLNPNTIYNGLKAAFTGGNIGSYSNDIAKIWNDDIFINGCETEREEALTAVKLLCCENNFVIDYAKTLYQPKRPKTVHALLAKYTRKKLPAFFQYAKEKENTQIQPPNQSLVNRIADYIPDQPINTRRLALNPIDYRLMMHTPDIRCSTEVQDLYRKLNRKYRYMFHTGKEDANNLCYTAGLLRTRFTETGYSAETITDMLIQDLYGNEKRYKQLLWFCFGAIICENLKQNLKPSKTKYIQCMDCGEWTEVPASSKSVRCPDCLHLYNKEKTRLRVQKHRRVHAEKNV